MRPSRVELYQIDENEFGELLIAVPDLGLETDAAQFDVHKGDCVLYFDDGEIVRLPDIPASVMPKLETLRQLVVAEFDATERPIRAYECGRIGS